MNDKSYLALKKAKLITIVIFFLVILTRFWNLGHPKQEFFDEVYHLPAVRLIARNDPRAYEWWHEPLSDVGNGINSFDWLHPPLAKLIQASFMILLGDSPAIWRLPFALAGLGVIIVIYFLSRQIFQQLKSLREAKNISWLAVFLASMSGLLLVQSRIAMNDIFLSLWLTLSLLFLFRFQPSLLVWQVKVKALKPSEAKKNLLLTGLFLGLALATKWSAVFLLIFILLSILLILIKQKIWKLLPLTIFSLLIVPLVIYLLSYSQMFLQRKSFSYFIQLHQQIFWYHTHRQEGHPYSSKPIQWFFNARPIWYWTDPTLPVTKTANIYALENPVLNVVAIMAVIYLLRIVIKLGVNSTKTKFYLTLLALYLVSWLPWIFSPRVMFYFHYLPALPILILITAEILTSHLRKFSANIFYTLLLLIFCCYVVFLPHWLGLTVPKIWVKVVYFAVSSWQ